MRSAGTTTYSADPPAVCRCRELNLGWDAYPMPRAPGPMLIVCTAEEGGPDDERLQLLAGLLDAPAPASTSAQQRLPDTPARPA
ncbi:MULTISPECIES: hypothetical protein [unclassified Streptomyces]|uniref:hypothetical protein n=1 Tax=unclassified Streptomyces TaxID=2593676 RepID=UPI0036EE3746